MGTDRGILTLTRVRMPITDSNIAFTGIDSTISLKVVRVSISAFSTAVVVSCCASFVGMSPTAQGPGVAMMQCGGRWGIEDGTVGSWIVGHEARVTSNVLPEDRPSQITSAQWINTGLVFR